MKKWADGIYGFGLTFIKIAGFLLLLILFLGGFFHTCYAEDMTTQLVLTRADNILWNLVGLLVLTGIAVPVCKWASGNYLKRKKLLLLAVSGWCGTLGLLLVVFGRTVPAADAMSVYSVAEKLAEGNLGVIHPTESYLSYYPQQIGLASFYEGIIRLWKLLPTELPAYHIIKCLNAGLACALIYFLYRSVQLLFKDDRTDVLFLLLAGGNAPLIMYTSFVYGEIPSFALFSAGLFFLLKYIAGGGPGRKRAESGQSQSPLLTRGSSKDKSTRPPRLLLTAGLPALLLFTFSVMLRKNTLVLIIAVLLVTIFEWIKSRRLSLLIFTLACAVCAFSILPLVQRLYELRAGNTLRSGVPAISYFAMGMQESSRGNGWYNGFNFDTYQATGMDDAQTALLSQEAIRERLSYFQSNPGYMAGFYKGKLLSQWADGTYACRQATLATFGGRIELIAKIYEGPYSPYFIGYCNAYQNLLYLGALLFALLSLKKKTLGNIPGLPLYLGMIGVLGGFLFHLMWEANARYIFPYGLLLLPYAAYGISMLLKQYSLFRRR